MRRTTIIRAVVCWLALSVSLSAQQYVFRAYRQAEGLKNLAVRALATSRNGFLWVATENGVYRFLGSGFERFGPGQGIEELDVNAVLVDSDDTVWVGTGENLYRWNGERFVPAGSHPIPIAALNAMVVEDAHHLLVVENHRLYRLEHDDQGRMVSYQPAIPEMLIAKMPDLGQILSVSVVLVPAKGVQVWLGCKKELYSWDEKQSGGQLQPELSAIAEWGTGKGLDQDNWEGVMMDHAGTLWAGGMYHVAVLEPGATRFQDRTIPGATEGNSYPHAPLIEDRAGRVLAPSEDGIARWDGSGWQIIGRANGLQLTGHVVDMKFDGAGDLWMGARGDGLYNWAGYDDWEGWNDAQKLPSSVIWAVVPSRQGPVYIGTDKGPGWIDPRNGSSGQLFGSQRWTFGQVDSLGINQDGSLWGGTFSAYVLRIDPKTGATERTAKLPALIYRTVADDTGRVFFTTRDGIYSREASATQATPTRVEAVDALLKGTTQVDTGCASPNGVLWFLSGNRLLRLKDGQWSAPPIDGLPSLQGRMLDLSCAPNGALWVTGQQTGTYRLTPGDGRLDAWQLVIPADLQSLNDVAIMADRRGWVWIGTDAGVLVWNGLGWRHLTQESGLIWNDVNQGVILGDRDGSIWIGTSGGLAHLLHPEHVFESAPLTALVTQIRRGNEYFSPTQSITLPWSPIGLHFQLSSPAMRNRSELVFRYRMEGLQPDWIDSEDGMAVFPSLEPGTYTFTVIACNPGMNAYSSPVRVRVVILPPWWKSWWFYLLLGLSFLLFLVLMASLYARHLRARSRQLERLVSERTHELELSREQLRIQATHDGLTGLLNRAAVLRALSMEMDRARREKKQLVVALVDLDHFKRLNDEYGHLAGDEALRKFSDAVNKAIRPYDHAGRYGGEEFLLILTDMPPEIAEQRILGLHASISNLDVNAREAAFSLSCSLGATTFDPSLPSTSEESVIGIADLALYEAKAGGRNRAVFHAGADRCQGAPAVPCELGSAR